MKKNKAIVKWLNGELESGKLERIIPTKEYYAYRQIIGEIDRWVPEQIENTGFSGNHLDRPNPSS